MSSMYDARWNYIVENFKKIKNCIGNGFIVEINEEQVENLVIKDNSLEKIIYNKLSNAEFIYFDRDQKWNYLDKISDLEKWFLENVKIYKRTDIDIIKMFKRRR